MISIKLIYIHIYGIINTCTHILYCKCVVRGLLIELVKVFVLLKILQQKIAKFAKKRSHIKQGYHKLSQSSVKQLIIISIWLIIILKHISLSQYTTPTISSYHTGIITNSFNISSPYCCWGLKTFGCERGWERERERKQVCCYYRAPRSACSGVKRASLTGPVDT